MRNTPKEKSRQCCEVGSDSQVEDTPASAGGVPQLQNCQWPKQRVSHEAVVGNEDAYDYGIF
jgi:hypothetical protein